MSALRARRYDGEAAAAYCHIDACPSFGTHSVVGQQIVVDLDVAVAKQNSAVAHGYLARNDSEHGLKRMAQRHVARALADVIFAREHATLASSNIKALLSHSLQDPSVTVINAFLVRVLIPIIEANRAVILAYSKDVKYGRRIGHTDEDD
eukprot:CAMPEP_0117608074 /NCGR_PEP_ID=MMETSP0784-20121206/80614_1 /TAXON_ID=39447 /ORGANISM="" /LENGTH=149 /DNA_ID=CAMNT_0005411323 /DNA_START=60 /DNA_END=506 /DNA_ORIENTATION=+